MGQGVLFLPRGEGFYLSGSYILLICYPFTIQFISDPVFKDVGVFFCVGIGEREFAGVYEGVSMVPEYSLDEIINFQGLCVQNKCVHHRILRMIIPAEEFQSSTIIQFYLPVKENIPVFFDSGCIIGIWKRNFENGLNQQFPI